VARYRDCLLMNDKTNEKVVPSRRFKGFNNADPWIIEPMGEVYSFKVTNSLSRDQLNYESGETKNIHYGDIHTKFQTLFDITNEHVPFINDSISLDRIKSENYCAEGDMVFADASEDLKDVGKSIELVNLNREQLLSGLHTLLARQKESKLVVGFGGYLFTSPAIRSQIQREAQGSKVLGISATRLSNIRICYPEDKAEQQKIAVSLSSLDELINAENKKLDALKIHKKALMQQLFPADGEAVPKLRFADFADSFEWEFLPIGSKVDLISGYAFPGSEISENSSGVPLMRGINITEGLVRHTPDMDRYFLGDTNGLEKFTLKQNDLVIGMDGSKVGKNSALITNADEGALLVQRVARLRADKKEWDTSY
jgi:type I restriction enzyme, S subunit